MHTILTKNQDGVMVFAKDLVRHFKHKENSSNELVQNQLKTLKNPQDTRDFRGASLLHLAAECGNDEITKYLIDLGFDINSVDRHRRTALMIAVKNQNFVTAKTLIELNADINICDIFGISILRMAIMTDTMMSFKNATPSSYDIWKLSNEYWKFIEVMLNKLNEDCLSNSEMVANQLLEMYCPLTHVVFMKNSKVMKIMIERGTSLDIKDCCKGQSALHLAVEYWKLDKVKILLKNGADVNALNDCKQTPIMCIYYQVKFEKVMPPCEIELIKTLLECKPTFSSDDGLGFADQMYNIFSNGSKEALRLAMIEDDDLFLVKNKKQATLLHAIAENVNPGVEQVLSGRKFDVNVTINMRKTVFSCAFDFPFCHREINFGMVEYLLSVGACPDSNGYELMPIVYLFLRYRYKKSPIPLSKYIYLLLEYGAEIDIKLGESDTILDLASECEDNLSMEAVLAQFAIRETLGVTISQIIRQQIQSQTQFKIHFNLCVAQLEDAKTITISKSVTVFEFLTASYKMISFYARDKNLILNLSKLVDQLELDPYYMYIIRKRFTKISQIAESREKAEEIIFHNIGEFYEYNSIVTRKIVEFLNDEDVMKLGK